MAATPELAIAKAALSASLFRADPVSQTRPSVESFFALINQTIGQCSRPNIQECKDWITSNIVHSGGRTTALGKFFVALSNSQTESDPPTRPSSKRRRLHILYILNDVLHHVVSRKGNHAFATAWDGHLPTILGAAASFDNSPKHIKKLDKLLSLWDERRYVHNDLIVRLREVLVSGNSAGTSTAKDSQDNGGAIKLLRAAPYVLPSLHGDPSTPWYDLPAATWLPHLVPNSTKPMLPDLIRPINLNTGPASTPVTAAVQALLADAERIYYKGGEGIGPPEDEANIDMNELGERIIIDEITNDVIGGETYYGWSIRFCERMKDRKNKSGDELRGRRRSRSVSNPRTISRSCSRDRSRSPSSRSYKRRRLPPSRSRSRSSGRRRTRSWSRSRSSRRNYSRSTSKSPPRKTLSPRYRRHAPDNQHDQPASFNFPPIPPPPHPPAGYKGPWPPPPPPPIPLPNQHTAAGPPHGWAPDPALAAQLIGAWSSGQIPPPPAPPPKDNRNNQSGWTGHGGWASQGPGSGSHRGDGAGRTW